MRARRGVSITERLFLGDEVTAEYDKVSTFTLFLAIKDDITLST